MTMWPESITDLAYMTMTMWPEAITDQAVCVCIAGGVFGIGLMTHDL